MRIHPCFKGEPYRTSGESANSGGRPSPAAGQGGGRAPCRAGGGTLRGGAGFPLRCLRAGGVGGDREGTGALMCLILNNSCIWLVSVHLCHNLSLYIYISFTAVCSKKIENLTFKTGSSATIVSNVILGKHGWQGVKEAVKEGVAAIKPTI